MITACCPRRLHFLTPTQITWIEFDKGFIASNIEKRVHNKVESTTSVQGLKAGLTICVNYLLQFANFGGFWRGRGKYGIWMYLSNIQQECPEIVCRSKVYFLKINSGINFKDQVVVQWNTSEMNCPQTCRGPVLNMAFPLAKADSILSL